MNLMKTSTRIALAISTALLSTSAFAADEKLKVYGKANIGFLGTDTKGETFTDIKSFASRFGAKGTYKLDNGLSAIYKFEWQVNLDTDGKTSLDDEGKIKQDKNNLSARSQYVGLKGAFGQIAIGRQDTSLKTSQGKIDLFNDYDSDIKQLWKGENRLTDTVRYDSPILSGFKVSATYVATQSDINNDDAGVSVSTSYGDAKLKKSNFYAAIAYDNNVSKGTDKTPYNTVRILGQAKFGDLKIGAMYHQSERSNDTNYSVRMSNGAKAKDSSDNEIETQSNRDSNGALVNASYALGKFILKGQFQTLTSDTNAEATMASVGLDYKLGKATKAYVWFNNKEYDKNSLGYKADKVDGNSNNDSSSLALGLEHKF